jgi:polyhydroxyalkanoate synthesis regulator phasin
MAKKRASNSKGKVPTTQVLSRLQRNMKKLQRDAEFLLTRTRRQATQLISRDQRRALDRLFGQAQRLRTDLEKRAQRASKDVESRAERFLSTLEKEAAKRMGPLLRRLDLPTRQEVHTLSRRIGQLERRLRPARATRTEPQAAATANGSPTPAEEVAPYMIEE